MTHDSAPPLASHDVPQANRVERVLALSLAVVEGKGAAAAPLGLHERDMRYYAHAAFVLGLLDREGRPTPLAEALAALPEERQNARLAQAFAESRVGRGWVAWAGVQHIGELEPDSAEAFLREAASLAPSTARRRAVTLQAWQRRLGECLPESSQPIEASHAAPSMPAQQTTLELPSEPLRIAELSERGQRHFQALVCDGGPTELKRIREQVHEHLALFEAAARSNELLPVDIAQALTAALERLLDRAVDMDPAERALVVGAARYFVSDEDASPDLEGVLGLDDDVTVFNAVVQRLGQDDLLLDL